LLRPLRLPSADFKVGWRRRLWRRRAAAGGNRSSRPRGGGGGGGGGRELVRPRSHAHDHDQGWESLFSKLPLLEVVMYASK